MINQPNRPPTPQGPSAAPHNFGGYVTFASFVKRVAGLNHVNEVYDYLASGENTARVLSACEQVKMAADDDGTLVYIKPCQILVVGEDVMLNATEYQGRGRPVKCHLWNINCVRVRTEDASNYVRALEEKERDARYQRQREAQNQQQRARHDEERQPRNEEEAEGPVEVETVIKLLKERVFLKDKATQVEICCSGRLEDDDDDRPDQDGDDNRSHSSRRSRHRNDDEEFDDDNLNYERND
ncbi:hypothetical protein AAVH_18156 [Aphelenchoides avenae]|nr:hypothetical protein AAVH_18156 [Aphelenchus avenae]